MIIKMTLDEAIFRYEDKVKWTLHLAKKAHRDVDFDEEYGYREQASRYEQVADWLKELKAYKEARKEITRKMNSGQWSEGVVYGLDKAVRIMEKHLREVNVDDGDSN
jgi:CRISPR/Cas system-associated endonuclease/helicase Cas3